MPRFADRHVKLRIQSRLLFGRALGLCRFHFLINGVDDLEVRIRSDAGGTFCGQALQILAKGQIVVNRFIMG